MKNKRCSVFQRINGQRIFNGSTDNGLFNGQRKLCPALPTAPHHSLTQSAKKITSQNHPPFTTTITQYHHNTALPHQHHVSHVTTTQHHQLTPPLNTTIVQHYHNDIRPPQTIVTYHACITEQLPTTTLQLFGADVCKI
jgi:hypothetical protein